jgi:sugar lactone lactonase YvrE
MAATLVLAAVVLAAPAVGQVMWTTVAGRPTGSEDGSADVARFSLKDSGVAVDAAGTVYVADSGNHRIRRVAPDGTVTTLAGSGEPGLLDGTAGVSRFNNPSGVVVAADGTVFVADTWNNVIRKITPDGMVSTLAGDGGEGHADGPAASARFAGPVALALDAAGNLLVADQWNHRIRTVAPDGTVSTVAGSGAAGFLDGPAAAAQLNAPSGVAVDAAGTIYIADAGNQRIRAVSAAGEVSTVAGTGAPGFADGPGASASFNSPTGVAVDASGVLLIADRWNQAIRAIAPDGSVSTLAGGTWGSADGAGAEARFAGPTAVAAAPGGHAVVADAGNQRLRTISAGGVVATLAGGGPTPSNGWLDGPVADALLSNPTGIAVDAAGTVFVADFSNHRIRKISGGAVTTLAGTGEPGYLDGPGGAAQLFHPIGLVLGAAGRLIVADGANHRIRSVAPDGTVATLAGSGEAGFADGPGAGARFSWPHGVAMDAAGNLLVADAGNHRIRRVAPDGAVTTVAGSGIQGFADGPAATAQFSSPTGVAVDAAGAIWVADNGNNRVRKVIGGVVTTVAGGPWGWADGPGDTAALRGPVFVAAGAAGEIVVTDQWNNAVRAIAPDGAVRTLGGGPAPGGADGLGPFARFRSPSGVAVAADGTILVSDHANNAVRIGRPAAVTAAATIDRATGRVGEPRQLGASGGAAAWSWRIVRRAAGSTAPLSSPDVQTPTFTPDAPGVYVFRLTAAGEGGVQAITEVSLDAYRAPTAAVSGDATICAGMAATLEVALTGTPPWSLTWSDGVTQTGIVASPAVRPVTPAVTTTYAVAAVTDYFDTGTATGSAEITVAGVAPSAAITAPAYAAVGRPGLVATVPDAGAGAAYAWTTDNGAITSGQGTPAITFAPSSFGETVLGVTVTQGICSASGSVSVPPAPPYQEHVLHFAGEQVAVAPGTSSLPLGEEFTLEAWVYLVEPVPWAAIVMRPEGADDEFGRWTGLVFDGSGSRPLFVQTPERTGVFVAAHGSGPLPLRRWTHLAGMLKDGVLSLYVNGRLDATAASQGPPPASARPFTLGGWQPSSGGVWNGLIGAVQQVRLWGRGLSRTELVASAAQHLAGSEPALLACWPLDEGSGWTARDLSPGGAHLDIPPTNLSGSPFARRMWWRIDGAEPFFLTERAPLPEPWLAASRPLPSPLFDFVPIDLDADGDQDIVVGGSEFISRKPIPLYALRNDGRGGLSDATAELIDSPGVIGPRDWAVADFNGDGRDDLFVAEQGQDAGEGPYLGKGGQSRILIQSADGKLVDETESRLPRAESFTHNVAAADVDGDGDIDLYLANIGGELGPQLLINDGSGRFAPENLRLPPMLRIAPGPGWPGNFSTSTFADVNNDGFPDLVLGAVVCQPEYPSDLLLMNDGRGYFSFAPAGAMPTRHGGYTWITQGDIAAGDLDGDGWVDLILGTNDCPGLIPFLQLLLNNGDGTFRDASHLIDQSWPDNPNRYVNFAYWISLADYNGDGWLDFLTSQASGARLFLNHRGRRFLDASAVLQNTVPISSARAVALTPGGAPDIFFLPEGPTSYYIARNVKPFNLTNDHIPRKRVPRAR